MITFPQGPSNQTLFGHFARESRSYMRLASFTGPFFKNSFLIRMCLCRRFASFRVNTVALITGFQRPKDRERVAQ